MLHLRFPLFLALFASATLFAGCDSDDLDNRDNGVRVATFTIDENEFVLNDAEELADIASYERRFDILTPAAVDGGVVLLYAEGDLVFGRDTGAGTWVALPYAEGVEGVQDGVPFVDFTITYTYSFEPDFLYFDVISSAQGLVSDYIPDNQLMRLVTIPGTGFAARGIDYSDYNAVKEAYNLPD